VVVLGALRQLAINRQLQAINQITYLSPGIGPFGSLYQGVNPSNTTAFHGKAIVDFGATFFARLEGQAGQQLDAPHNFGKEWGALKSKRPDIFGNLTPCAKTGAGGGSPGASGPGEEIPDPVGCITIEFIVCDPEGGCYPVDIIVCPTG
jgi:hypothetical protein